MGNKASADSFTTTSTTDKAKETKCEEKKLEKKKLEEKTRDEEREKAKANKESKMSTTRAHFEAAAIAANIAFGTATKDVAVADAKANTSVDETRIDAKLAAATTRDTFAAAIAATRTEAITASIACAYAAYSAISTHAGMMPIPASFFALHSTYFDTIVDVAFDATTTFDIAIATTKATYSITTPLKTFEIDSNPSFEVVFEPVFDEVFDQAFNKAFDDTTLTFNASFDRILKLFYNRSFSFY